MPCECMKTKSLSFCYPIIPHKTSQQPPLWEKIKK